LIPVEEYLRSSYDPDCDYVDGRIEERNLGELDHGWVQAALIMFLGARRKEWGIQVIPELRVSATRYRVPDVTVVLGPKPSEQILTKPPFLCIEILSPEDRMGRIRERIQDYLTMGVAYVWVVDPQTKQAYVATASDGFREVTERVLRTESPAFEVPLDEIFS